MNWTYDDFYREITLLKARVEKLECERTTLAVTVLQHRRALSNLVDTLETALTEPPRKFTPEEQATWNAHCRYIHTIKNARKAK